MAGFLPSRAGPLLAWLVVGCTPRPAARSTPSAWHPPQRRRRSVPRGYALIGQPGEIAPANLRRIGNIALRGRPSRCRRRKRRRSATSRVGRKRLRRSRPTKCIAHSRGSAAARISTPLPGTCGVGRAHRALRSERKPCLCENGAGIVQRLRSRCPRFPEQSDKFPGHAAAGVARCAHNGTIETFVRRGLTDARFASGI